MHDLGMVFQKLDSRHKASPPPDPQKTPCAKQCKRRASLDADWISDLLLLVIVAALFAAWAGGQ